MKRFLIICTLLIGLMRPISIHAQSELRISSVAWSPDGRLLAVGTSEGVNLYDSGTLVLVWSAATVQPINIVQFSPSGTWLAAGLGSGTGLGQGLVQIWIADSGEPVSTFEANRMMVRVLAFSPDENRLVTGGGYFPTRSGGDYRIRSWNTANWEEFSSMAIRGTGPITAVAYSSDGQYLVFSSLHGPTNLIDVATNKVVASVHQESADWIHFDSEASKLILGFYRSIQMWELRSQPELHLVRQTIWNTAYSENIVEFLQGEYVIGCDLENFVTSSEDSTLRVRSVETGEVVFSHREEDRRFTTATLSPDNSRLAFVSDTATLPMSESYQSDQQVAIWKLGAAQPDYLMID